MMKKRLMSISKFAIFITLLKAGNLMAMEPIILHYVDRPPYAISDNSQSDPKGLVADPTEYVFKKAKIPFIWSKTPINRQFMLIKSNKANHCAIGMEKTIGRSEFATFTEPVYMSPPLVAIMRPQINESKNMTIVEMLSKYSILIKENYTLGDELTDLVMKSPKKEITSSESIQMVKMVAQGHADFMMISNDEVEYYIKSGVLRPESIRLRKLIDVNKSFTRRIMCNKSIDPAIIAKLNSVIKTLNIQPVPMKILNTLH
jgi:uncharacterized protein (TIGR02285 family)